MKIQIFNNFILKSPLTTFRQHLTFPNVLHILKITQNIEKERGNGY